MARQLRRGLTFANVCSFIALVVALGTGGAYAANTIGSDDIIDESIQSVDIMNGEVKIGDLGHERGHHRQDRRWCRDRRRHRPRAVDGSQVVNESLTDSDLATNSVQATEIADDRIDTGEIVDNSLFAQDLAPNSGQLRARGEQRRRLQSRQ